MKFVFRTGIAAAALLLFMFRNAHKIQKEHHALTLETTNGFRPFRLVFIADIHRKKLPLNFLDFPLDAIIIGGDLTEQGVPLKRTADNLKILTDAAPVFFIWGNNDREVGEWKLRRLLAHFHVKVMDNESVELFGNPHLKLVGIDYFSETEDKFEKAFSQVMPEDTVIFASHTPSVFKFLRSEGRAGFLMAGHTHGGQIRLGKIGLYRKGSMRKFGSSYELVTNGIGTTSLPLRLGAEAQYHIMDIEPRYNSGR
ncbi:metallophosphoesterase [Planococcus salinarum]|uniref:metallophosphoesterase n=1 Tax=Planococcus salinarum TaxID=622695 RepID=UPI000E3D1231|nr:metallophosphoesterase [Planococcus salinarum]TAA72529.1 phosphoesterase [Planococcus salinarum]